MDQKFVAMCVRMGIIAWIAAAILEPATAKNWIAGSGNWNVPANWSPAAVPAAFETVNIVHTDGTSRSVTLNTTPPTLGLVSIDLTGAGTSPNFLLAAAGNSLSASAIFVGGYNGSATTNGRGAVLQTSGTISTTAGSDWVFGHGAGSNGTYSLSGTGAVVAAQSMFIGYSGTGKFSQTGGSTALTASAVGSLNLGAIAGSSGTYELSGGTLSSAKMEYVGDAGTGVFDHSGGSNSITGTNGLTLGFAATGSGTYTARGTASLSISKDLIVGLSGSGTFNVQDSASVNVGQNLSIGASDFVNLNGGTLRFDGYNRNASGVFAFTAGTLQLGGGTRVVGTDPTLLDIFGVTPTITAGKSLVLEGGLDANQNVFVTGGSLSVGSGAFSLRVGEGGNALFKVSDGGSAVAEHAYVGGVNSSLPGTLTVEGSSSTFTTSYDLRVGPRGTGTLNITNGGTVVTTRNALLGDQLPGNFTVALSGAGSKWMISDGLAVGINGTGTVDVQTGTLLNVGSNIVINNTSTVTLNGGTLRFNGLTDSNNRLIYNSGTLQLGGNRTIGADSNISRFYGAAATVPTGKGLTIEGNATIAANSTLTISGGTFKANGLVVNSSGILDFDRGIFQLSGGVIAGLTSLTVPTNGEFRASGVQPVRVTSAAGSTITATGALTLGDADEVNGFYTDGNLNVGANTLTLLDANDVAFDTGVLATLGSGASPGTLNAANGLTLDFGGNLVGYGTVATPNIAAKPTIVNGHVTGNSAAQKLTLTGYVKGVGTFDHVNFAGTFSPGLSPTSSLVGNLGFAPSSTLAMEIGGAAAGSQYDQLISSGQLAFDGTLLLTLINGFAPTQGQSFNLFDWETVSGAFGTLSLPSLGASLAWDTSQLYTTGVLSVVGAGLPGDYNQNGVVDTADYVVWRNNLGSGTSLPNDDTAGVGNDDYSRWRAYYGQTAGGGAAVGSAVPEGSTVAWLCLWVAAVVCRRSAR